MAAPSPYRDEYVDRKRRAEDGEGQREMEQGSHHRQQHHGQEDSQEGMLMGSYRSWREDATDETPYHTPERRIRRRREEIGRRLEEPQGPAESATAFHRPSVSHPPSSHFSSHPQKSATDDELLLEAISRACEEDDDTRQEGEVRKPFAVGLEEPRGRSARHHGTPNRYDKRYQQKQSRPRHYVSLTPPSPSFSSYSSPHSQSSASTSLHVASASSSSLHFPTQTSMSSTTPIRVDTSRPTTYPDHPAEKTYHRDVVETIDSFSYDPNIITPSFTTPRVPRIRRFSSQMEPGPISMSYHRQREPRAKDYSGAEGAEIDSGGFTRRSPPNIESSDSYASRVSVSSTTKDPPPPPKDADVPQPQYPYQPPPKAIPIQQLQRQEGYERQEYPQQPPAPPPHHHTTFPPAYPQQHSNYPQQQQQQYPPEPRQYQQYPQQYPSYPPPYPPYPYQLPQHQYYQYPPPPLPPHYYQSHITPSPPSMGPAAVSFDSPQPPPIIDPHRHYITKINETDVLCGRGGATNSHVGNRNFRNLVKQHQRDYLQAKKKDKPSVAASIVNIVRNSTPQGRFLKKDKITGFWLDIGDLRAREKTSQALREGAPELRLKSVLGGDSVEESSKQEESDGATKDDEARKASFDGDENTSQAGDTQESKKEEGYVDESEQKRDPDIEDQDKRSDSQSSGSSSREEVKVNEEAEPPPPPPPPPPIHEASPETKRKAEERRFSQLSFEEETLLKEFDPPCSDAPKSSPRKSP